MRLEPNYANCHVVKKVTHEFLCRIYQVARGTIAIISAAGVLAKLLTEQLAGKGS